MIVVTIGTEGLMYKENIGNLCCYELYIIDKSKKKKEVSIFVRCSVCDNAMECLGWMV